MRASAAEEIIVGPNDAYKIQYEAGGSIIHVVRHGFWTPEISEQYYAAMSLLLVAQRGRQDGARVLVDRRGDVPQSQETVSDNSQSFTELYQAGDRYAILCDAGLLHLQLKRICGGNEATQVFTSRDAAVAWLTAFI